MGIWEIRKLILAFNSSEKPWQISLAFYLGAFLGFLPFFNPFHLLVLVLALWINLNFSLFLFSFFLCFGFSSFLDPFFQWLGHALLTASFLKPMWTSLFQIQWLRIFKFHHILTMGIYLVFLVLFLPYFYVANRILRPFMGILRKFTKIPVIGFLFGSPPEEEEEKEEREEKEEEAKKKDLEEEKKKTEEEKTVPPKKVPIIRLNRLVASFVLFAILFLGGYVYIDYALASLVSKTMSLVLGTHVELKAAKLRPPLSLKLEEFEVWHPKKKNRNLVEAKTCLLSLNPLSWLEGKYEISEMALEDLKIMSFSKHKKIDKESSSSLLGGMAKVVSSLRDIPQKIDTDFWKKENLTSLAEMEREKRKTLEKVQKWKNRIDYWKARAKEHQAHFQELKERVKKLKSPGQIPQLLQDGKAFIKEIQKDKLRLSQEAKELKRDLASLDGMEGRFKEAIQKDWQELERKYSLFKGGNLKLAKLLLGEDIGEKLDLGLELYRYLAPSSIGKAKKAKEMIEKRQRKDRAISFPLKKPLPDFLIKKMDFSFWFQDLKLLEGKGKDISSDPEIYGKAGRIEIQSPKTKLWEQGKLVLLLDKKEGHSQDTVEVEIKGFPIRSLSTPLGITLEKGRMDMNGKVLILDGKKLKGQLTAIFEKIQFGKGKKGDEIVDTLLGTLLDTQVFQIKIVVGGTLENPSIQLKSDLDFKMHQNLQKKLEEKNQKFLSLLKKDFQKKTTQSLESALQPKKRLEEINGQWIQKEKAFNLMENQGKNIFTREGLQKMLLKSPWKKIKNPLKKLPFKNPFK